MSEFFLCHGFVSDGDVHAGGLLQLELDGGSDVVDLRLEVFVVRHDLGEHTDSVEDGSEDGGNFLDEGVSGEEHRVLLGPLLDQLLVLVEVLEGIEVEGIHVDVLLLDDLEMLGVSNDADSLLGSGDVGESDGTGESLILLGIVVLQADLELYGLLELSLLLVLEDGGDTLSNLSLSESGSHIFSNIIFNIYFLFITF